MGNSGDKRPVVVDKNVVMFALRQENERGDTAVTCQDCIGRIHRSALPAGHTPTILGWYWTTLKQFAARSRNVGSGSLIVERWLQYTVYGHGIRVEDSVIEAVVDIAGVSDEDQQFAKLTGFITATLITCDGGLREHLDAHLLEIDSSAASVHPMDFDASAANYARSS